MILWALVEILLGLLQMFTVTLSCFARQERVTASRLLLTTRNLTSGMYVPLTFTSSQLPNFVRNHFRMLNGELRRLRQRMHGSGPSLSDTFLTSVDTLSLFRKKEWWQTKFDHARREALPRPSSFSLGSVYKSVFKEVSVLDYACLYCTLFF